MCALEFERFWFVDVYTPNAQGELARLSTRMAVCALEFERFWFVDVYTPNAQGELARLSTRMALGTTPTAPSFARSRTKRASRL